MQSMRRQEKDSIGSNLNPGGFWLLVDVGGTVVIVLGGIGAALLSHIESEAVVDACAEHVRGSSDGSECRSASSLVLTISGIAAAALALCNQCARRASFSSGSIYSAPEVATRALLVVDAALLSYVGFARFIAGGAILPLAQLLETRWSTSERYVRSLTDVCAAAMSSTDCLQHAMKHAEQHLGMILLVVGFASLMSTLLVWTGVCAAAATQRAQLLGTIAATKDRRTGGATLQNVSDQARHPARYTEL
eukprot:SAG31_NODE_155_length_22130_cov_9.540098_28_plen_249_part_00